MLCQRHSVSGFFVCFLRCQQRQTCQGNDPLLAATIHCTDGDINPKKDGVIASGYCGKITDRYPQGENLTWKLTTDGTLTISGTGEMADWGFRESPWYEDGRIKRIVIENGVTSLGNWAFCACSHMTSVTIPDSVTSIGWAAFYECTSLTSVEIPGSVTSIGDEAFLECTSLTSITIPDSVTSIGTYAFYACSSLTRITIPDGVTSIDDWTFGGCSSLTSVTIPDNVTSIEYAAFESCSGLKDVYYSGTKEQWDSVAIAELDGGNDPLLNARIHFLGSELPEGVKFVPYSHSFGEAAEVTAGRLPRGLSLDEATGELTGAPLESGSFEFTVRRANVSAAYQLTVQNNSNSAVQRPNDYDIIENVGTQDPYDPNSFYKEDYSEETFAINGPYEEFYRLLIDGREKIRDVDYTVREGSTIITVRAQTFQNVGEGTHTIAAEFRGKDSSGKDTMRQAAQNYTLTIRRPSENTGSGSSGGSGGSSSPTYSIKVPKIPNCTIKVSPTGASEGTRITLTVRPDTGYVLSDLTVTGPKDTKVALTQKDDFKYTFRMPDGKVSISAQVEREQPEPTPAGDTPFLDVKETDWFYHDVAAVYAKGWMVGTSKDTFSPSQQISRGMIVTVLHRIAGEPAAENTYFADVPLNRYYTAAAAWAVEQGIVTGYGDGHFGPSDPMTREQIIMILYNYANLNKLDTSAQSELSQFTDLDQLSSDARRAMSWAYSIGLIRGKGDGILDPAGATTRAETAAFLIRFVTLTED